MNKLNKFSRATIAIAIMLCVALPTFAHDFVVNGIYYNYLDETAKTVKVTYRGSYSSEYSDEYTGAVSIPSSVTYNSTTYSVTSIGEYAFYNCSGLTSVTIPNSVTSIGDDAFYNCTGLTSVTIGNSVTSIGNRAFYNCTGLTSVTIPNSVTSIGTSAFKYCRGLTSVTIPNSVTTIGSNPFSNTGWYKNQPDGILYLDNCCLGYKGNKPTGTLSIKEGTRLIAGSAFFNCSGLTSVTIPNSVTSIGSSAFSDCSGLTSITIPNSVTSIAGSAFFKCRGLTSITIPNSVISIGSSAFYGCYGLTSVTIGNSVTSIGWSAFYGCSGLTSITIPNSVTSIGEYAFDNCSGLTSVTIGNSVTSIGEYAFDNTGWYNNQPDGILYLDNCCLGYKGNKPTGTLSIKEGTRLIAGSAFYYCTGLTSITIPNSVTSIGDDAFRGCSSLTSVTIPNSVTSIGDNAFWGCNKLISSEIIDKTQTTVSIALATPTKYQTGITTNENEQIISESNNIFIKGLKPNTKYTYNYSLIFNDIFCDINSFSFTTNNLVIKNTDIIGVTSASSKAYCEGDVSVIECGINWENSSVEYNNLDSISAYNLDPNTTYYVYYLLNTKEGGEYSTSWSITTKILSWNAGEFTATSTTSARLSVETNCDATEGTGYEWIRYDAPNNLTPNKAPCPIVNGMLRGSLRGLNSNVYYKCRPYYTSSSGKTHYGAWFTIFTGDTNVYFEPEVSTSDNTVVNNTAIINGYALAGSDDILEQGFEYWNASATPSAEGSMGIMTVKASGISMSATITNLNYNSTYRYRAFAKTANGTFYGSEKEFTTSNDQSGVESFESDVINAIEVARYDIHGRLLSEPARGINIIKMSDGTTSKEIVK